MPRPKTTQKRLRRWKMDKKKLVKRLDEALTALARLNEYRQYMDWPEELEAVKERIGSKVSDSFFKLKEALSIVENAKSQDQ